MTGTPDPLRICIVLDKSGSMEPMRTEALAAVNSYIAAAKADPNLKDAMLGLMLFDSTGLDWRRRGVRIAEAEPLTLDEYVPGAMTPLFDAIGSGAAYLDADSATPVAKAVLIIVTDGMENASREHTAEGIRSLLDARRERGWMVEFLAKGLDVAEQGVALGVQHASISSFADGAGLVEAFSLSGVRTSQYACAPRHDSEHPNG